MQDNEVYNKKWENGKKKSLQELKPPFLISEAKEMIG